VEQAEAIELILQRAVEKTLAIQKRLGNPISICKDGKVVTVSPEEIVLSPRIIRLRKIGTGFSSDS
jgi:hypothetical protein